MTANAITWNTHKVDGGFECHVYSFGYQQPTETLRRATFKTRAQAAGYAKRWMRWYKSQVTRDAVA